MLSPLGGAAGHYCNRAAVVAAGCFVWGATMVGFAFARTLGAGVAYWAVTGLGLCLVIPSVQSLTADLYPEADRGKAFGTLHLTSALGAALGGLYATNVAASSPFGWEGWRFAMLLLGVLAFAIGAASLLACADPRGVRRSLRLAPDPSHKGAALGGPGGAMRFAAELGAVLRVPTFLLIVLQGIVGNIPMASLSFQTLYLQAHTGGEGRGGGGGAGGVCSCAHGCPQHAHTHACMARGCAAALVYLPACMLDLGVLPQP